MNPTCFDCGAALTVRAQAIWTCTNAACPAGTEKHLCGYCKESSFSPSTGICANRACRTHKVARSTCPSCQYQSVLTMGGLTFCLNRSCPTHAGWVAACPTCTNDSLIQLDGTAVCVKSTCANLLYLVPWPASIGSRRGLGGSPQQTGAGVGQAAPATTALRRPATANAAGPTGVPRYRADPDASTIMPGAPVLPKGFDENAETVLAKPPMTLADSGAATVLDAPPKAKALPPGFDENAETVLQSPPKPKPNWIPPGFDENAETVMAPPSKD